MRRDARRLASRSPSPPRCRPVKFFDSPCAFVERHPRQSSSSSKSTLTTSPLVLRTPSTMKPRLPSDPLHRLRRTHRRTIRPTNRRLQKSTVAVEKPNRRAPSRTDPVRTIQTSPSLAHRASRAHRPRTLAGTSRTGQKSILVHRNHPHSSSSALRLGVRLASPRSRPRRLPRLPRALVARVPPRIRIHARDRTARVALRLAPPRTRATRARTRRGRSDSCRDATARLVDDTRDESRRTGRRARRPGRRTRTRGRRARAGSRATSTPRTRRDGL